MGCKESNQTKATLFEITCRGSFVILANQYSLVAWSESDLVTNPEGGVLV